MDSYYILYFNQIYFVSWCKKKHVYVMPISRLLICDNLSTEYNNVVNFSILLTLRLVTREQKTVEF